MTTQCVVRAATDRGAQQSRNQNSALRRSDETKSCYPHQNKGMDWDTYRKAVSYQNQRRTRFSRPSLHTSLPARYNVLYLFVFRMVISEVFTNVKVKLRCSEVRAIARVKLSLPTLPQAKLHYPQDNFTYEVNFTCPHGQTQFGDLLYRRSPLCLPFLFYKIIRR